MRVNRDWDKSAFITLTIGFIVAIGLVHQAAVAEGLVPLAAGAAHRVVDERARQIAFALLLIVASVRVPRRCPERGGQQSWNKLKSPIKLNDKKDKNDQPHRRQWRRVWTSSWNGRTLWFNRTRWTDECETNWSPIYIRFARRFGPNTCDFSFILVTQWHLLSLMSDK